jgi:hypothetical protein
MTYVPTGLDVRSNKDGRDGRDRQRVRCERDCKPLGVHFESGPAISEMRLLDKAVVLAFPALVDVDV